MHIAYNYFFCIVIFSFTATIKQQVVFMVYCKAKAMRCSLFFPQMIKNINDDDKVLEIGPGATPHFRSDEFLEYSFDNDAERIRQSGNVGILNTDKPVHYYTGDEFPFPDKAFDYVICSHVIEHVPEPIKFIQEMTRISLKGYIEFPLASYEYLYNIPEHLHLISCKNNKIRSLCKSDCSLDEFSSITDFMRKTLNLGYRELPKKLRKQFFCGFEWENDIEIETVASAKELDFHFDEIPVNVKKTKFHKRISRLFKGLKRRQAN